MVSKVTSSEDNPDKKIEEIKKTIEQITNSMQMEMYKLIENAIKGKATELKKKKTTETPIDSAKLVMRLLNHIKSHNEHQNVAIEKMMTAQEIADKYGIEFYPDPEIILDLAEASSEQAEKLMKSVEGYKNNITNHSKQDEATIVFVPYQEDNTQMDVKQQEYYNYELHHDCNINNSSNTDTINAANLELVMLDTKKDSTKQYKSPPPIQKPDESLHLTPQYYYWQPIYDEQMIAQRVNPKPNHFNEHSATPDNLIPFLPVMEETSTYIISPEIHESEPEPEMVGEEYEETVSSKVFVERGKELGTTSVNHATTYTLTEKAHFKPPPMVHLPQQMQYTFYFI
ncbi:hypothetical protein EVAR_35887_1 [Eumeta japonica]|uniref:Uncharacterized protein n=1 Tax=Eumeta variegata TaxID=151549 RepID=A0A4C1WX34_EUMVA|nr:hypothetical protein EVAR_35887_1 [Eumeta japonica]